MTKHTIEIECLPKGWEPVAYRVPHNGDMYLRDGGSISQSDGSNILQYLILQKTKPREITLVETDEDNIRYTSGFYANQLITAGIYVADQPKIWRIKEE